MEKIVILGGGSFIGNLINYIESMNCFDIVGYTDTNDLGEILGVPYLGSDKILYDLYANGIRNAALGIGNRLSNTIIRKKVVSNAKEIGFIFPVIKGSNVIVHRGASIAEGAIIRDAAIIQSNCKIGAFVMIGDNVVISHDTTISDFAQVVTGSIIGNSNTIGDSAFIGFNSVTVNKISIAPEVAIGAKSLVNKDCVKKGLYFGQPAQFIKNI